MSYSFRNASPIGHHRQGVENYSMVIARGAWDNGLGPGQFKAWLTKTPRHDLVLLIRSPELGGCTAVEVSQCPIEVALADVQN
jgi:hypothetical protein